MNQSSVADRLSMSGRAERAIAFLTVLTPKPGMFEELLELQLAHYLRLARMDRGITGIRVYRALDDTNIVSLSSFDTIDDHARSSESGLFIEHVNDLGALIERANSGYYQLQYAAGNVEMTSVKPDPGSVIWLNIVTTKSGKLDEFLRIQVAEQDLLRGSVAGVQGNRIYRSLSDESKALMLACFDTPNDHKRWVQSDGFAEHVHKLLPLIERGDRGYYKTVYESGEI